MKKYISFIIAFALLICTVAVSVSSAEGNEYWPTNENVRIIGRYSVSGDAVNVGYGLTELNFNVKAESVTCTISTEQEAPAAPYFAVYVNGKLTKKFKVNKGEAEYTLASGLSSSKTTNIRLVKTNERWMIAKIGKITVAGGEIAAPSKAKGKLIEVIGDSISAAYGILATDTETADDLTTDATYGYAKILADKMGADVNLVAESGKGIYCNYNGEAGKTMPAIYDKNPDGTAYSHTVEPDVIIVNLGTNDVYGMGVNKEITKDNITAAAKEFIAKLREVHKNSHIVWTYGLMNSDLTSVIEEAVSSFSEDGRISFIPLPAQSEFSDGVGKSSHPDITANKATADYLFEKLINNGIIGSGMPGYLETSVDAAWDYDSSKMLGDANNDYDIDICDLVRMNEHSENSDIKIDDGNADYNSDGKIDSDDIALLRKQLLKN